MSGLIDHKKERAMIIFSDLHIGSENTLETLDALAAFSTERSAIGLTVGDNNDSLELANAIKIAQQAPQILSQYPEEKQEELVAKIQGLIQEAEKNYVTRAQEIDARYAKFHSGKVYGVNGNHDHPALKLTNFESLEGKLLNVGGSKITGIDHYSARFLDPEFAGDAFYNVEDQLKKYAGEIKSADTILMHEGARKELAHKEYHKGLEKATAGKNIVCGHVHKGKLTKEGENVLLRSAPKTAYFKEKNATGKWEYFEIDLKGLVEHYNSGVAGKIEPSKEYRRAA